MSDQADGLRELIRARSGPTALAGPTRATARARSIVMTSGKGGVGTSNLALNLSIALGDRGNRVVLIDADLGLANIDLLCGLSPTRDLGDVLIEDGPISEAMIEGPGGIKILPGAHASRTMIESLGDAPGRLVEEFARIEAEADYLIIDAGSGLGPAIGAMASAAEEILVVTTPEPTSMADAHAAIGRFRRLPGRPTIRAIVNQATNAAEAEEVLGRFRASSRQFLGAVVDGLGHVRSDPHVPLSVRARQPFLVFYPTTAASKDVRRLARTLNARDRTSPRSRRPGFFASLAARWDSLRVAF